MFPKLLKVPFAVALFAVAITAAAADIGYNVRVATLYLAPDTTSTKMVEIDRGRELGRVPGGSPPGWLHVMPTLERGREVSGWVLDKGVVWANTPNGDRILFGEAVESEKEASKAHGRRGADREAMRLYYAVYDLFPKSELAGEALYRSADVRWQIDYADVFSRPSAKEMSPDMRTQIDTYYMKEVMKKFPGTKWADLAAFHLIDNKLCGEWQGLPKCPEKESEMYEKYAAEHPQSPDTPEALYKAAWRQAVLIEIYRTDNDEKKSSAARQKALALAQQVASKYPQNDWGARGQLLAFLVQQGVNVYSTAVE
jgi:outer membrane protein assembly factor BamD (BamD/ComL family)